MVGNIADVFGGNAFDANSVEATSGDFSPLPAGWYIAEVEEANLTETKKQDGCYINVRLNILTEGAVGRKVFEKINIKNPSETCVQIGFKMLASLSLACGIPHVRATEELLGKIVKVKLKVAQDKGYKPDNKVVAFAVNDGVTAAPAPSPATATPVPSGAAAQPATATATAGAMPWNK